MSTDDAAAESLVGQVLAERYRIEALLGTGGMGAVYRAKHVHMKKDVAVKVLHKQMTLQSEVVARFEREAVAAARIDHPNVAAATDFGRLDDDSFYLVLEYVEGKSLSEVIRGGPLPQERVIRIARQIAEALFAAHAANIVHRDLKPDNVMLLEREGEPDFVKVLDFGIAKVPAEDSSEGAVLTKAGTVFGTPEYMAPEQAKGQSVDARADLYTLGMIMYEMLSGQTAFAGDDLLVVLTRQMTAPPPPLPPVVGAELERIVMKLLEKEPERRYRSAADLLVDLEASSAPDSQLPMASTYRRGALSATDLGSRSTMPGDILGAAPTSESSARMVSLFFRPVHVAGRVLPAWWLLAPGLLLLSFALTISLALLFGSGSSSGSRAVAGAGPMDGSEGDIAQLSELMNRAREGDRMALSELRREAGAAKRSEIWVALGRGYAKIKLFDASLSAYEEAVGLDTSLIRDPALSRDVREAASDKVHAKRALEFAASFLGARGADLIYDVWLSYRRSETDHAIYAEADRLMAVETFRAKASPALTVVLDLKEAKGCSQYKKVLERAVEHADSRSGQRLKGLTARRGCGFLGIRDCWSCLRGNNDLSLALARAAKNRAFDFATEVGVVPSAQAGANQ